MAVFATPQADFEVRGNAVYNWQPKARPPAEGGGKKGKGNKPWSPEELARYKGYRPLGPGPREPVPGGPPGPWGGGTDTAEMDPYLVRHAGNVEKYYDELSSGALAGRLTDRMAAKRRAMTEGQRRAFAGEIGKRGLAGPGTTERDLLAAERSDIAGGMTDIQLEQEGRRGDFLLGSTGALAAPGQSAREGARLGMERDRMGLDAWSTMQQVQMQRQRNDLEMALAQLQAMTSMMGMFS
jgi:hypothetical protein